MGRKYVMLQTEQSFLDVLQSCWHYWQGKDSMIYKANVKLSGFLWFQRDNYWKYLIFNNKHGACTLVQFKDNVCLHANSYSITKYKIIILRLKRVCTSIMTFSQENQFTRVNHNKKRGKMLHYVFSGIQGIKNSLRN